LSRYASAHEEKTKGGESDPENYHEDGERLAQQAPGAKYGAHTNGENREGKSGLTRFGLGLSYFRRQPFVPPLTGYNCVEIGRALVANTL
jgi:hypothetical protein